MTRTLRVRAPAKINLTLDVLRIRPDGYHEVRSVLQTLDLSDTVTLSAADGIELVLSGEAGHLVDEQVESNLAYRAAASLVRRLGVTRGVRIELEKRIPLAAGFGGGSSDAVAVLRGCDALWDLRQTEANLIELAGEIGSDPPFFVVGGTATIAGRGERVRALPDASMPDLLLALPPPERRGAKTASMFAALEPRDFTEGYATIGLEDAVEAGRPVTDGMMNNVFERAIARVQPTTEKAMAALRAQGLQPHLAGAGPSFFLLLSSPGDEDRLQRLIRDAGFEPMLAHPLSRADALLIEEI